MTAFLAVLATVLGLLIAPESDAPYDRLNQYGGWIDADHDCVNTRHQVLAEESLVEPTWNHEGCRVIAGLWKDPYTGMTFYDPRELDVDHVVPLSEAHDSGAWAWSDERRRAYANDLEHPEHLTAVQAAANRQKRAYGPEDWLPPNRAHRCRYVQDWVTIKRRWGLSMDPRESRAVLAVLQGC